jgi:ketosteroid isomerase-like protein
VANALTGDEPMLRHFQVVTTDKKGKQSAATGQLVIVWKKQTDGSWKVAADTNADDK